MNKHLLVLAGAMLLWLAGLQAQDCATGFCPAIIKVHHKAGSISPITADIAYPVVESSLSGEQKCWIAQNLGATAQASSETDNTVAASGWYWQFGLKQGYYHDGSTRTPNTTWITSITGSIDWLATSDPCTLLLGSNWRLPTDAEWINADSSDSWGSYTDTYSSELRLHPAGQMAYSSGTLGGRGTSGYYWSSTRAINTAYALSLYFHSLNSAAETGVYKSTGASVRCLRDY